MVLPRSTTANEQQYIYNFLLAMPVNSTTLSLLFDEWRDNLIGKCKPNELSAKIIRIAATCKTAKRRKNQSYYEGVGAASKENSKTKRKKETGDGSSKQSRHGKHGLVPWRQS